MPRDFVIVFIIHGHEYSPFFKDMKMSIWKYVIPKLLFNYFSYPIRKQSGQNNTDGRYSRRYHTCCALVTGVSFPGFYQKPLSPSSVWWQARHSTPSLSPTQWRIYSREIRRDVCIKRRFVFFWFWFFIRLVHTIEEDYLYQKRTGTIHRLGDVTVVTSQTGFFCL